MDLKGDIEKALTPLMEKLEAGVEDRVQAVLEGVRVEVKVTLDMSDYAARLKAIQDARGK